jgi:hypothetical protein
MEYVNGFASNVFENKSLRKGSDFLKDNLEKIAGEYEPPGNENAYELKNRSDSLDDGERAKKRKVKNPYETD